MMSQLAGKANWFSVISVQSSLLRLRSVSAWYSRQRSAMYAPPSWQVSSIWGHFFSPPLHRGRPAKQVLALTRQIIRSGTTLRARIAGLRRAAAFVQARSRDAFQRRDSLQAHIVLGTLAIALHLQYRREPRQGAPPDQRSAAAKSSGAR